jgi:hypothetical protein
MKHPAENGWQIIEDTIHKGSTKDGCDESWRSKPKGYHRMKAIRHLINAQMIEDGVILNDGEPHDENALTRIAMALAQN